MKADSEIRLAMLGMIPGNGHPYSWSAIINGYDPEAMAACPFPVIRTYLGQQPLDSVRIPGARVTHIWTDDPNDAPKVAAASKIGKVVARPEDVIGEVDAVIIATDDGSEHVRRSGPFVSAGLPVLVDKPLATNLPDLKQFAAWQKSGRQIFSCSGLRYAPELDGLRENSKLQHPSTREAPNLNITNSSSSQSRSENIAGGSERASAFGGLRWITSFTCNTWERYGIHALEAVYPIIGPGFTRVQTFHEKGSDVVHLFHRAGVQLSIAAIHDAYGSFGNVHIYGTKGHAAISLRDTYTTFRRQLLAFIEMVRSGQPPFPFDETIELMAIIIAGIRSRESGRDITLEEIFAELHQS
jgi:predicted dehydrogenase